MSVSPVPSHLSVRQALQMLCAIVTPETIWTDIAHRPESVFALRLLDGLPPAVTSPGIDALRSLVTALHDTPQHSPQRTQAVWDACRILAE